MASDFNETLFHKDESDCDVVMWCPSMNHNYHKYYPYKTIPTLFKKFNDTTRETIEEKCRHG